MAPSQYDWKIVDWDVKPQHNQRASFCATVILFERPEVFVDRFLWDYNGKPSFEG